MNTTSTSESKIDNCKSVKLIQASPPETRSISLFVEFKPIDKEAEEKLEHFIATATENTWIDDVVKKLELQKRPNNWNLISFANFGLHELTMNFVASLKLFEYDQFLIFCFDLQVYRFLHKYGLGNHIAMVPRSWLNGTIVSTEEQKYGYDQPLHSEIVTARWRFLRQLLDRDIHFLLSDVDVVFNNKHVFDHLLLPLKRSCGEKGQRCSADYA